MIKAPVIGIIRYSCRASYTRKKYFQSKYQDYRLEIFKNVTLKSLQEQTDMDFNILLLHSDNLPQKYKDIFKNLEKINSFLYNIYISDSELEGNDYINAVQGTIKYIKFINNMSINFRIDNDDAVPCDFISRLKEYLKPEYFNYIISFPNISIIQRIRKYKFLIQDKYLPSNSIGLAYITNSLNYRTIMTLGDHGKVNKMHTMILLPYKGGIQTINGKNIMNTLYFLSVSRLNNIELKIFLKENGYPNINFDFLGIYRRNLIVDTIKKIFNFIKKKCKTKK